MNARVVIQGNMVYKSPPCFVLIYYTEKGQCMQPGENISTSCSKFFTLDVDQ